MDIARVSTARSAAEEALLDAAERVLLDSGYPGVTTRRLAEEAGVNHGLVQFRWLVANTVLQPTT